MKKIYFEDSTFSIVKHLRELCEGDKDLLYYPMLLIGYTINLIILPFEILYSIKIKEIKQ